MVLLTSVKDKISSLVSFVLHAVHVRGGRREEDRAKTFLALWVSFREEMGSIRKQIRLLMMWSL